MGYLTKYEIEVLPNEILTTESCEHLYPERYNFCPKCGKPKRSIFNRELVIESIITKIGYDPFGDKCKWYEYREDMKDISKHFPKLLIRINGFGDNYGDIWVEYYKNGKIQICEAKITIDDFDESKLQ